MQDATELSRGLRRRQTGAEELLWQMVRRRQVAGFKFYRQRPVGRFIVDFYCPEARLVIELDGGIHECEDIRGYDSERQQILEAMDLRVLRFTNEHLEQHPATVLYQIQQACKQPKGVST
ncbi:MAG: endonuclease domain-containing protein [Candidatus Melainabacteria bacterium]